MAKETQQPTQENLEAKQKKLERAIEKISVVSETIGSSFAQKRLAGLSGVDFLEGAIQLGSAIEQIKERLANRARPELLLRESTVEEELKRVREKALKDNFETIRRAAQQGLIPSYVLEEASKQLVDLGLTPEIPQITKQKEKGEVALGSNEMAALTVYLTGSEATLDSIVDLLRNNDNGKSIERRQVTRILSSIADVLYQKLLLNEISEDEHSLWNILKRQVHQVDDREALKEFRAGLRMWKRKQTPVRQIESTTQEPGELSDSLPTQDNTQVKESIAEEDLDGAKNDRGVFNRFKGWFRR